MKTLKEKIVNKLSHTLEEWMRSETFAVEVEPEGGIANVTGWVIREFKEEIGTTDEYGNHEILTALESQTLEIRDLTVSTEDLRYTTIDESKELRQIAEDIENYFKVE